MKYEEGDLVEIIDCTSNNLYNFVNEGDIGQIIEIMHSGKDYPIRVSSEKWLKSEVFCGEEIVPVECESCGSEQIYHDKKQFWICPFCDL